MVLFEVRDSLPEYVSYEAPHHRGSDNGMRMGGDDRTPSLAAVPKTRALGQPTSKIESRTSNLFLFSGTMCVNVSIAEARNSIANFFI